MTRLLHALGRALDRLVASNCTLCGASVRGALCPRCTDLVRDTVVWGGNPYGDLADGHERQER